MITYTCSKCLMSVKASCRVCYELSVDDIYKLENGN